MKILDQEQIKQKIKRLAIQILENNYGESEIFMAGINKKGLGFAKMIRKEMVKHSETEIKMVNVILNPADPLSQDVTLSINANEMDGKVIILVDDVANTGRTLFYAFKPLLEILPKKIEVAVLVNRKHKQFPVQVDYEGISLATTIQDNIEVHIARGEEKAVYIQ